MSRYQKITRSNISCESSDLLASAKQLLKARAEGLHASPERAPCAVLSPMRKRAGSAHYGGGGGGGGGGGATNGTYCTYQWDAHVIGRQHYGGDAAVLRRIVRREGALDLCTRATDKLLGMREKLAAMRESGNPELWDDMAELREAIEEAEHAREGLMRQLNAASYEVVNAISQWKAVHLGSKQQFMWEGGNYLLRMQADMGLLDHDHHLRRRCGVERFAGHAFVHRRQHRHGHGHEGEHAEDDCICDRAQLPLLLEAEAKVRAEQRQYGTMIRNARGEYTMVQAQAPSPLRGAAPANNGAASGAAAAGGREKDAVTGLGAKSLSNADRHAAWLLSGGDHNDKADMVPRQQRRRRVRRT